jgi:hypothetical protein
MLDVTPSWKLVAIGVHATPVKIRRINVWGEQSVCLYAV